MFKFIAFKICDGKFRAYIVLKMEEKMKNERKYSKTGKRERDG